MFGFLRKRPAPAADPARAAECRARGNAALGSGALDEAADHYREAIAADPGDAAAHVNLGYVLLERSQPAAAVGYLQQAVALAGSDMELQADAHYLLGRAHQLQGATAAAIASYRAALAARASFDEPLLALVPLLVEAGRLDEAMAVAHVAAGVTDSPVRLLVLAHALQAAHRAPEALEVVDAVLAREPESVAALDQRGNLLLELGRPEQAVAAFERTLALHGADPDGLCNLAAALLRLGSAQDALARLDEALRMQPAHDRALHAKGQALLNLLRLQEAREFCAQACRLRPGNADLQWNQAVAHLLLGELAQGWPAHEARWQASGFVHGVPPPFLAAPRWTGQQDLRDATILLFAEQGLGDSIQFLRYVPMVAAQASQVLLSVQPTLAPLATGLAPNCRLLAPGEPLPVFDLQCPLLSLPHAFGTSLADVPSRVPYLHAQADRVAAWRERLPTGTGPKVGIAWSGNPQHANDHNRSVPLDAFRVLADAPVQYVNLQPQVRAGDREALVAWPGLFDAGPQLKDFADTAVLMMALDLVITVDTSVAHLAGALGRPVWILLPYCPDWRWMVDRSDSPWYPSARLYRQAEPGAWAPVLARVHADLQRFTSGTRSGSAGAAE